MSKAMLCIITENKHIPPIGLAYLATALKNGGYAVSVNHITPTESENFIKKVIDEKPLFVGFSIFVNSCLKANSDICRKIKSMAEIPIVFGGPHTSILPEEALNFPFVDYVAVGDGEKPIVNIARIIEKKLLPEGVKGIGFKKNGKVVINKEPEAPENLDEYELDWNVLNVWEYCKEKSGGRKELPIITSRGCPYQCRFCYNAAVNGMRWRTHSESYLIKQANNLKERYGINFIRVIDDNFLVDRKRALSILSKINLPFSIHCRIDQVEEEFFKELNRLGCQEIMLGVESGSDRILDLIGKSTKVKDTISAFKILAKYPQIKILSSLMFYVPTETKEERVKTAQLIREMYKITPNVECFLHKYAPCPKTKLYEQFAGNYRKYEFDEWPIFSMGRFYYINESNVHLIDELENEMQGR